MCCSIGKALQSMDKFEITLEELEQLCNEFGLELTKHYGHSFTNVYVKLPESEIWNKDTIDARGVISCTFIDTSIPLTIEPTEENTIFELFFTFRGNYKSGYSLVCNCNNPFYGLRNAADLRKKFKWLVKKFKEKQIHYKLKHLEKDFM